MKYQTLTDRSRFSDFAELPEQTRESLMFQIPVKSTAHIVVAVEGHGVINPMDHPAFCRRLDEFAFLFRWEGRRLYSPGYYSVRRRSPPCAHLGRDLPPSSLLSSGFSTGQLGYAMLAQMKVVSNEAARPVEGPCKLFWGTDHSDHSSILAEPSSLCVGYKKSSMRTAGQ